MKKITILIAEDMDLVRQGFSALLGDEENMEIVGEAPDGRTAVEMALRLKPDVVLMDLTMPGMGGVEATAEIKRHAPEVRVLALTAHGKEGFFSAAAHAGVDGYMLKHSHCDELVTAITTVASGRTYFSPEAARLVARATIQGGKPQAPLDRISKRERQVLALAAQGLTNKDIAKTMFVSSKTVEKHKTNLKKKLGLRTSLQLAAFCLENGLAGEE